MITAKNPPGLTKSPLDFKLSARLIIFQLDRIKIRWIQRKKTLNWQHFWQIKGGAEWATANGPQH